MKPILKLLGTLAVVLAAGWYLQRETAIPAAGGVGQTAVTIVPPAQPAEDAARKAFSEQASGRMVHVNGRVQRMLTDDRDGSPHQRFIIVTDSGQSLLVAHNLDLAPRLEGLAAGEQVSLYGEYEWNAQGGVMHWTHDDPQGRHAAGYVDWRGRRYQ
jgi:hypothetical protein